MIPNLRILVEELGLEEVARRLGVVPKTIRRWLQLDEVPRNARAKLTTVFENFLRAKKTAETKAEREAFRDSLKTPPLSELPPELVLPNAPPDPLEAHGRLPLGVTFLEHENYYSRVSTFEPPSREDAPERESEKGIPFDEVDFEDIAQQVITTVRENLDDYPYWRVVFIYFQFFADNPAYKGELVPLRATYKSFVTSTETWELLESVREVIDRANRKVIISSKKRFKWLYQYQVHQSKRRRDDDKT